MNAAFSVGSGRPCQSPRQWPHEPHEYAGRRKMTLGIIAFTIGLIITVLMTTYELER